MLGRVVTAVDATKTSEPEAICFKRFAARPVDTGLSGGRGGDAFGRHMPPTKRGNI